jgi:uncharacterized protein (TIGR03435 family)
MLQPRLLGAVGIVAVGWIAGGFAAQTPTSPAFEVASVKPNKSGTDEMVGGLAEPGGRFTVTNTPLREIIRAAYRVQRYQVAGGPSWIDSDRFDIVAKANGSPSPPEILSMLRPLLAERFKLAVHNETRQLPVFALVVAGSAGKLGPHLRPSDADCIAEVTARLQGGAIAPPPADPLHQPCGSAGGPLGYTTARGLTMGQIAFGLSRNVGRAVMDRTGLAGYFDYELTWTPDQMPPRPPGAPDLPPVDPNGSSIFTALQEQLGLKMEPTTGPVDVIVIDHVEQPTPD